MSMFCVRQQALCPHSPRVSGPTAGPGHREKHREGFGGGTGSGSEGSAHLQIQAKAL